jgi:hypothetical protein
MLRITTLFFLVLFGKFTTFSQEFDLQVKVVPQAIFTVDPVIFSQLEVQIKEFVNTTSWTNDQYQKHERIKGTLQIVVTTENSPNTFSGELILQTQRPVFNSNYESPMLSLIDKQISFRYTGVEPVLKTTNTFYDNLSSILSFYMNIALAMDYDSFSPYGGEGYLEAAREIITSLPSNVALDEGWRADLSSKRNRYYILENSTNPVFRPYRQSLYEYHRLGLDKIAEDPGKSRAIILSALTAIGQADQAMPNSILMQIFGNTKRYELIEIFMAADKGQKTRLTDIMVGMDKTKRSDYKVLE